MARSGQGPNALRWERARRQEARSRTDDQEPDRSSARPIEPGDTVHVQDGFRRVEATVVRRYMSGAKLRITDPRYSETELFYPWAYIVEAQA